MTAPPALVGAFDTPFALQLRFVDVDIDVRTNDADVWARLRSYFAPFVIEGRAAAAPVVRVIQGEIAPSGEFVDVTRAGARRVKEAVREIEGGRLILKRATGIVMGLWPGHAFAVGDVRAHLNQPINLVNSTYAKAVMRRGHLLLHASAVVRDGRAVVLAGVPGAGKSTAALHLVEHGYRFLSNDRTLARPALDHVEVLGYPKQPRVNPGTLLHHPRLASLLTPDDRAALLALPVEALWNLERKCDVDLEAIYGDGTVQLHGRMEALVLLKWRFDGHGLQVRRLRTAQALASLRVFHKDLGAFDPDAPAGTSPPTAYARYVELLSRVQVLEILGRTDFDALRKIVSDLLA